MFGSARRKARRAARRTSRRLARRGEEPYGGEQAGTEAADRTAHELRQLAKLRDEGVLTDEEFEAKKRQVLGI
jgi:hypothetical protein